MAATIPGIDSAAAFEAFARRELSAHFGVELAVRPVMVAGAVRKQFNLVSADSRIVGDAKWYKDIPVPAAKFSTISEYVWLLQAVKAERVLLVFGKDVAVPERYLRRFHPLVDPVEFVFLDGDGLRWLSRRQQLPTAADRLDSRPGYGSRLLMAESPMQIDDLLIHRHIESDPFHPGPGDVRLVESGVAVWAIIGHLASVGGDTDQAASDYEITPDEMAAALAYYRRHRGAIDARLSANAGGRPVDTGVPA